MTFKLGAKHTFSPEGLAGVCRASLTLFVLFVVSAMN
jgi:hypothetical protein